jgi:hypothetical protein
MTMQWRNEEASKRFAELVTRGDGVTAAVEGQVVTVHPTKSPVDGVTITAANPGKPGDSLS